VKSKDAQFLTPGLKHELYELLEGAFSADSMDQLGALLFKRYSGHDQAGEDRHLTLSRGRAARLLVDAAEERGKTADLIQLIAELDGKQFQGRLLTVPAAEVFFNSLARVGVVYDPARRKLYHSKHDIAELRNWGSLRDGRTYTIAIMSIDIVGNSQIVRELGAKKAEKLSFAILTFLQSKLDDYDGRLWNWAGDGGLFAFAFDGCADRAIMCGVDIQRSLPLFLIGPRLPVKQQISLRIAIDVGPVKFVSDTGRIVSDVINYAAHLEKGGTNAGQVSISERVANACDGRLLSLFHDSGEFEGLRFQTTEQLDSF
jgi:class 3 adenylate cyclase